jgi:hypothetical protein
MTGDRDMKSEPRERLSKKLIGAQRLASRLQRAIRLGETSPREMQEVDLHVSSNLISRTANAIDNIDTLLNRSRSTQTREMLSRVNSDLRCLLSELKLTKNQGYSTLIREGGKIDPKKLDNLIDLDSEIAFNVAALENSAIGLNSIGRLSGTSQDQIHQSITITTEMLGKRRRILETG